VLLVESPPVVAYAAVFAAAAVGCLGGAVRAGRVEDAETRRGLMALLVTSGGWAAAHVGLLLVSTRGLKSAVYLVGLVFGFSTVFAWLYFCSAYTGRTYHRQSSVRSAAVGLYLLVVLVKLTNPAHHLYFTTGFVSEPFRHLAIQQGLFHWVVTGLSYTLSAVGMFALFEAFEASDYDARPLGLLVALAGIPVVLDVVGFASPLFLDVIHAPLGVAAFAMGTLFVFEDRFFAVQLTDGVAGPTIFLDDDRRIRECNDAARRLFPGLEGAVGESVDAVPAVARALESDRDVVDVTVDGDRRHYVVSDNAFETGQGSLSRIVVFSDVTRIERQRRELERHDDQLSELASGMRHELRNAVTIIRGNVRWAATQVDDGEIEGARASLRTATETTDRATRLMNDFATLAQYGQSVTDPGQTDVAPTARAAWASTGDDDVALTVDVPDGWSVAANPARLELLFERSFEFLVANGASTVTVAGDGDELRIGGDVTPLAEPPERYFAYGEATDQSAVGTALPMVRTLARVHGWRVSLEAGDGEGDDGGARLVVDLGPSRP
jgi:signal transduction histidine kinase